MRRPGRSFALFAVVAISVGVFWRTAYPTITWWDSANYSLAAHTLGLTSPPGSLLLTLLGWPVSHLPLGMSPARVLNLFAGLLAGVTAALVFIVAIRLRISSAPAPQQVTTAGFMGAAVGALTFAFSATLWEHAIKFTPYVLTAVFTGLILWTMLRWWNDADDPGNWRWLIVLGVLFGLDFSVHRTNALLIPGAIAWIAIRKPQVLTQWRSIVAGGGGLAAGLAVHLLVIPIARYTPSPVNMYEPSSWARFWSYVSLENSGGNFLLNVWPRKSPFWSTQVMDVVNTFRDNFFHWATPASLLGILPAIAAVAGLVVLFRRSKSLATAWSVALFLQIASTVIYFNIPADFFRPFDRHYLPILVMIGMTIAFGMSSAAEYLSTSTLRTRTIAFAGAVVIVLLPIAQLTGNWTAHDASRRRFTEDFARNSLESLPRNAIYFTVGDNDTFPTMYLQGAEGVRPDIRIVNVGLSPLDWYVKQAQRHDPTFAVSFTADERLARARSTRDTLLSIPIDGTTSIVRLQVKPSFGATFQPTDLALMDIVSANRWRRPITFATTSGSLASWLTGNPRLEGLYWRVDSPGGVLNDSTALRENLMTKYVYRGYADSSVRLDYEARAIGFGYFNAFKILIEQELARGNKEACRAALGRFLSAFPIERLGFEDYSTGLRESCG